MEPNADQHSPTEVLCRCAWCDGVFCDGRWRALTKARRVLQAVAGNPIGDAAEHWVICPSCLESDFRDLRFGLAA